MDKSKFIDELYRLIDEGKKGNHWDIVIHKDFLKWRRDVLTVLTNMFDGDSDASRNFENIDFSPKNKFGVGSPSKIGLQEGLHKALLFLSALAEQQITLVDNGDNEKRQQSTHSESNIDKSDEEKNGSKKLTYLKKSLVIKCTQWIFTQIWKIILGVIIIILASILWAHYANTESSEILISDLVNWYNENNAQYDSAFHHFQQDQARRGVFESGVAIGEIVEMSEAFRRRRDITIDSFFVRIKSLGVNPETLGIERRLPIHLDKVLKKRLERMGLYRQAIQQYRIDTL